MRRRKRWRAWGGAALIGLSLKVMWVAACAPTASVDRDDVDARQRHLIGRTLSPSFETDHIVAPGGVYGSEWRLVALSMTAAAVTNLAYLDPGRADGARREVAALVEQTLEPEIRSFEKAMWNRDPLETLHRDRGHMGYLGHLAFMMSAHAMLGGDDRFDAQHRQICDTLARRMRARRSLHVETYPGETYTADNSVGVAALALYDRAHATDHYAATIADWVSYTRTHLIDDRNGVVVFGVGDDGLPRDQGRGSAAGYNSFYLPFIDASFAAEQRARLRESFVQPMAFGAIGINEYTHGRDAGRGGDVDTGPLFFGVSPSATGFAIAAARHDGDEALATGLLRTAELAGFTVPAPGGHCYALAPLVGDAIVLAMRTATPWPVRLER